MNLIPIWPYGLLKVTLIVFVFRHLFKSYLQSKEYTVLVKFDILMLKFAVFLA